MYQRAAAVDLRAILVERGSFEHLLRAGVRQDALRLQINALVDELKREGWRPERIIIAVRQIAAESGLTESRRLGARGRPLLTDATLLAQLVQWSIERYYADGSSRTH